MRDCKRCKQGGKGIVGWAYLPLMIAPRSQRSKTAEPRLAYYCASAQLQGLKGSPRRSSGSLVDGEQGAVEPIPKLHINTCLGKGKKAIKYLEEYIDVLVREKSGRYL